MNKTLTKMKLFNQNPILNYLFLTTLLIIVLLIVLLPISAYSQAQTTNQIINIPHASEITVCTPKLKHYLIQLAKQSQFENSKSKHNYYGVPLTTSWLQLIDIIQTHDCSISSTSYELESQLYLWQRENSSHPALYFFPSLFNKNKSASSLDKEGTTIRLAVLAPLDEYFQPFTNQLLKSINVSSIKNNIKLTIYDTSKQSLTDILLTIEKNNDNCILGPLRKEKLNEITKEHINLPILALNTLDSKSPAHAWLFQISLSADSQVTSLMQQLEQKVLNKGVLFYSQSNESDRNIAQQIFQQHHSALGEWRDVVPIKSHKIDFGREIKKSLHLDKSIRRYQRLESLIKHDLEFEPRRRQDIDFISLVISQKNLQNLYPQIRYWFTDKLPIYALLNEKELIKRNKKRENEQENKSEDFHDKRELDNYKTTLSNLNLILPRWYKEQVNLNFLSRKLNFLGENAVDLIKQTQCLRLEKRVSNTSTNSLWHFDISSKTFIINQ